MITFKRIARLSYGEAIPKEEQQIGNYEIFGSNGPFGITNTPNTLAPVIIIGRKGSFGKINWSEKPVWATDTTFFIDKRFTKSKLKWLFYILSSLDLDNFSSDTAIPGISREKIYDKKISIPSIDVQNKIANYLDRKTAELDRLITAKKKLLSLLDEKKQALIAHAVTRGLDSDVGLKDSGIPWLGLIPEHWQTERTKWLLPEIDERSETGEEELLSVSHLTGVTLRSEKNVNMFMAESLEGYKKCSAGDLVINTLWAWMGAMGVSWVNGVVSPAYNVYRPVIAIAPDYLDLLVRMPNFVSEITRYSKGVWSSRLRLYPEGLYEAYIPVPPLGEQKRIVSELKIQLEHFAKLYKATDKTIFLLQERRAALISATVTGKIDQEVLDAD